jgi:hypothetical protein
MQEAKSDTKPFFNMFSATAEGRICSCMDPHLASDSQHVADLTLSGSEFTKQFRDGASLNSTSQ